jgi:hypothetical protein
VLHFAPSGWRQAPTDGRTPTCIAVTSSSVLCPSSFAPRLPASLFVLVLVLVLAPGLTSFTLPAVAHDADPFVVTNTADSGVGSLRQAILWANEHPGPDKIDFAIPGAGPHRIVIHSALPKITDTLYIRGATQPGADCSQWPPTLMIQLDGENLPASGNGLQIYANDSVIEGLVISRFGFSGIDIIASRVTVRCNFIGTDPTGSLDMGNGNDGVWIWGPASGQGDHNVIGVNASGQGVGNLISGNGVSGIGVSGQFADDNLIAGNFIGVDKSGSTVLNNVMDGVRLRYGPDRTQIGGALTQMRNVISGNTPGVYVEEAAETRIIGNFIGVDAAGAAALPNAHHGIYLSYLTPDTVVRGNLISGNSGIGLMIAGSSPRPMVQGNIVGADASGSQALGNSDHGIYALGCSDGLFGGENSGEGNIIAFNGSNGILVGESPGHNRISGNRIFSNGLLGIDLGFLSPTGVVTPNDPGDTDTGFNDYQNFPVLDQVFQVGDAALLVQGRLDSHANADYRVEFFASAACDPSEHGEGERYLGDLDVTTDGAGMANFTTVLATTAPEGWVFTATATDAQGNTSEFSRCRRVEAAPPSLAGLPLPQPDQVSTPEDTSVIVDVLANDHDLDGSPLTVVSISGSPNGVAHLENNQVVFAPTANYHGVVILLYGVSDGDPDHGVVQSAVRIQVAPVNDPPVDIALGSAGVVENRPVGASVGNLAAVDPDAGDSYAFYLLDGADSSAFFLNDSQLLTRAVFDFERKSSYAARVRVVDGAGAAFEKDVAVRVLDANDAPTAITLSNNRVMENEAAGALVGALSSNDPDAGDTHVYALVAGAGSDDNALFVVDGASLRTAAPLDYEERHQRAVRIASNDSTGARFEQAFLIAVGDQPSPPDVVTEEPPLYCRGGPIILIDNKASQPTKRVQVLLTNLTIANAGANGCSFSGTMALLTNSNAVTLTVSAQVNARNEFTGGSIQDFTLAIAGLTFEMRGATLRQYAGRPQIAIGKLTLQTPKEWGGLKVDVPNTVLIDSGGVHITGGAFKLPSIKTQGGYGLSLSGSLVAVDSGYEIAADGELTIPNIGKTQGSQGQSCGLSAGVTIFYGPQGETVMVIAAGGESITETTADAMQLRRISLGFHCTTGIPIASTGLFLTAVKGTVTLRPNEESVDVEVTIVTNQKAGGKPVAVMDGTMSVDIKPSFRLDLGVSLQLVAVGLVQANAIVTERSFSTTLRIDAAFVKGSASISAWSTDNNRRWHFTGSMAASLYAKARQLGEICYDMVCVKKWCNGDWFTLGQKYPCAWESCRDCVGLPPKDVGPLGTGGAQFGEFSNGRYGIKGYFELLNKTFGFFIDEQGEVAFGDVSSYQLAQGPALAACGWPAAAQGKMSLAFGAAMPLTDERGRPAGVLIPAPIDKRSAQPLNDSLSVRAADVISQVNLVRHSDVAFILEASAPLGFSVIDPEGFEITPASYQSHPRYTIGYEQSEFYEPESATSDAPGWATVRFTHAAPDAALGRVDVKIDGQVFFAGVNFTTPELSVSLPVAPGSHTIEVEPVGGVAPLPVDFAADAAYSIVLVGDSATGAAPALLVTTDDGAPPDAAGVARLRLINGSILPLTLMLDGAPLFDGVAYRGVAGYAQIAAGDHDVELRSGGNVVGAAQTLRFDEGDLYTLFTADNLVSGHTVRRLQRLDRAFRRQMRSEFAVDQADPGDWQVKLTGDTANIPYILAVLGPSSPPVLGSLTVDANNLAATVVGWQLTADNTPVNLKFFVTSDPITRTLVITGAGSQEVAIVPAFEGFAVAGMLISDPAQLGGAPATRTIDLSQLESGDYHLWVQADDGVNPPVNGYAALPAAIAASAESIYGRQAVRIAQAGYDPLAQLANAAMIHVDHSGDFPAVWDAAIRPTLSLTASALYVEWDALDHPDVDSYLLVIDTQGQSRQVISAGGAAAVYDGNGVPVGDPVGFASFADVEPGRSYTFTVVAEDVEGGRNAQSGALVYTVPTGDFRIYADAGVYLTQAGQSLEIPLRLSLVQPLLHPEVSLSIDLTQAALGMDASFASDAEGVTTLSAAHPTAALVVETGPSVEDGTYLVRITGRNGPVRRITEIPVAVGRVDHFLPMIVTVDKPQSAEAESMYLPLIVR